MNESKLKIDNYGDIIDISEFVQRDVLEAAEAMEITPKYYNHKIVIDLLEIAIKKRTAFLKLTADKLWDELDNNITDDLKLSDEFEDAEATYLYCDRIANHFYNNNTFEKANQFYIRTIKAMGKYRKNFIKERNQMAERKM